jgi:hypothetical protein
MSLHLSVKTRTNKEQLAGMKCRCGISAKLCRTKFRMIDLSTPPLLAADRRDDAEALAL